MTSPEAQTDLVRFGPFEFDRGNLELRKRGYPVKLQPQPLAVLRLLAESAGRVVSREEIRSRIWSDDTFVDFERGINFAISQIRAALGDDPAKPRFIETVPRRGYRFLDTARAERTSANSAKRRATHRSLAVLPFTNGAGSRDAEYLGEGISESIINLISKLPDVRVVPRSSAFRFRGPDFEWKRIARELNVDVALTGTVAKRGDRLNVQTELVDVKAHTQVWGSQFNRRFEDILGLQEELAREICECLRPRLSSQENELLSKRPTENREAYLLYLKASFYANKWTPQGIQQGFTFCRQAIEKDPLFASAFAALAYLHIQVSYFGVLSPAETFPAARAAALKALQIDNSLATAHACLAYILLAHDWDWAGAEAASRRAIELAPNVPGGHHVLSLCCLVNQRPDEAIREAKYALELDPLSVPYHHNLAFIYQAMRKYELGVEQIQKLLQIEPNFSPAHEFLAFTFACMGRYEEAFAELDLVGTAAGKDPRSVRLKGLRGTVNAMAGNAVPEQQETVAEHVGHDVIGAPVIVDIAKVHAHGGDAFALLVVRDTAEDRHLGKGIVAIVMKEEIPQSVITYEDIHKSVTIVVRERNSHRFADMAADRFLRMLIESRPFFRRIPDQSLIVDNPAEGAPRLQATRDSDGTWAMIYFPTLEQTATIRVGDLKATDLRAFWFDPRSGVAAPIDEPIGSPAHRFRSPPYGPDWVLVIETVDAKYGPPALPAPIK